MINDMQKSEHFAFFDIDVTKATIYRLTPCLIAAHYLWHFRDFALYSHDEYQFLKNKIVKSLQKNHHPYREHVQKILDLKGPPATLGLYPRAMLHRLEPEYIKYILSNPEEKEEEGKVIALPHL